MARIDHYRPTTPGRRHAQVQKPPSANQPERTLVHGLRKQGGRNAQGKITVRHQGGGHKQLYRQVDFLFDKFDIPAKVITIEYDPNRSARIALLHYRDGEKRYMLAPAGLTIGREILVSKIKAPIQPGNRLPLEKIPTGMMVHNVEINPGRGGQLGRSAGNGLMFMSIEGDYAQLKLPSNEIRLVPKASMASLGALGNEQHKNIRLGKAGRLRWRGVRPRVRGKAMNPVDHPHGGGEGLSPIGLKNPKTPWGKVALGRKTRRATKSTNHLILRRRNSR